MSPEKVDFDRYTRDYNRLLAERTSFFSSSESYFAWYKVNVARRLLRTVPQSIYEFGCGIGRNLPFLAQAFPGATLFASDISQGSVSIARTDNPGVTFWTDGAESVPSRSFDFVFVAGVYHHVALNERLSLTRTLLERVRPGGDLLVFEHNPFNPVTRRIVNACPFDADAVLLKPKELRSHLETSGLTVVRKGYALFVPPVLKGLTRLDRLLEWLPLGGQYWIWAQRPLHE